MTMSKKEEKSNTIKLIDTAGIAKKSNIEKNSINYYSIRKSLEKIINVDSALILIDSEKGIDRQDKRIINIIVNKAKSIIIIYNKIDLIKEKEKFKKNTIKEIECNLKQIKNIKVFFCTSFSKKKCLQNS